MVQQRYFRRVIRIKAEDSPNVQRAFYLKGQYPTILQEDLRRLTMEPIVPGVLTYDDYLKRRATWDKVRQCIGLDAEFYAGAAVLLFPPDWLNHSETLARSLGSSGRRRMAKGIGVDPAEGGDKTAMAAVDEYGVIELVSLQTPDTNMIPGMVAAFMRKHQVVPDRVAFDRGGGGKQHADRMRAMTSYDFPSGMKVRTVAFGESIVQDIERLHRLGDKQEVREDRYAYKNRRAEMYGELSILCDPNGEGLTREGSRTEVIGGGGFALPAEYTELRHQLSVFPKEYDDEGRMVLPPKNRHDPNSNKKCLTDMIGHSPDEADAVVLAVHAMVHKAKRTTVGVF